MMTPSRAVAVTLATVLLASGCCSKPKGSSGSTGPSLGPPIASAPPMRVIEMKPGSDDPPASWTSPAQSKAAAPAFAQRDGYAPQLAGDVKVRLFEAAEQGGAPISADGGPSPCLVVCSVRGLKAVDTGFFKMLFNTGAADMNVRVTLDKGAEIVERGPEDRAHVHVSVPLVDCSSRKRWRFHLLDRDGGESFDDMGTTHVTPPFPLKKADAVADLACRAVAGESVESELQQSLATTDETLERIVEDMKVDPTDSTLGVQPVLSRMQRAVNDLAGWVGWADPRVIRRRDWGLRILAAMQEERLAFVKEHASQPANPVTFRYGRGEYEVGTAVLDCDAEKVRGHVVKQEERLRAQPPIVCLLTLKTRNLGGDILSSSLGEGLGWNMVVARDDGETAQPRFLAFEGAGVTRAETGVDILAEGASGTVVLGLPAAAFSDAARPVLLVMSPFMSEGPVFVPLPASPGPAPAVVSSARGK